MPGIIPSALQGIDFGHVDRAPVAEQRDQDRQADRGLGRGHGEDEEHEHLPGRVSRLARERDEVDVDREQRSEEHTSELQSLMRISYAVFCLKKKKDIKKNQENIN